MYHDTIHISFIYNSINDLNFNYNFYISKNNYNIKLYSPVRYDYILQQFEDIGFNLNYLKLNDITDDAIVYSSYNYQNNFEIFFKSYDKIIKNRNFNIYFEYGNIIEGVFIQNNMSFFSGIYFSSTKLPTKEHIISGKYYIKTEEKYQIVNKQGKIIHRESVFEDNNFEQHFFEKYEVKVALREFKLEKIKNIFK